MFLKKYGLGQFAESFEDFGIVSIDQAQDLEAAMLSVMGMTDNDIEKLQHALEEAADGSETNDSNNAISIDAMVEAPESNESETAGDMADDRFATSTPPASASREHSNNALSLDSMVEASESIGSETAVAAAPLEDLAEAEKVATRKIS